MIYLIATCCFLAVLLLVYIGVNQVLQVSDQYEKKFTNTARIQLSDLFIFINPQKIYALNIGVLVLAFLIASLVSGSWVVGIIVGVILGNFPRFLWRFLKNRRNNQFLVDLPDALLSISSMMRAGTNLSSALETLVAESKGPISQEFGLFLRELKIGVDQSQALDNLVSRMPLAEVELFSAAMKISREIGGSLAEVLARLSDTLRRKLEMEGKIKSLTAQGKAQGWVMGLLPLVLAIVLFQMEPEAMGQLFTNPWGWLACAVFSVFMYFGYFFIKKIVTIDV